MRTKAIWPQVSLSAMLMLSALAGEGWTQSVEEKAAILWRGYTATTQLIKTADVEFTVCHFARPRVTAAELCVILDGCVRTSPEELEASLRTRLQPLSAKASFAGAKFVSDGTRTVNRDENRVCAWDGEKETSYDSRNNSGTVHLHNSTRLVDMHMFYLHPPRARGLNEDDRSLVINSEVLRGEDVEHLQLSDKESGEKLREVWVDTKRGYLPRRLIIYESDGKINSFLEADCLTKHSGRIWYPKFAIEAPFLGEDTPSFINTYVISKQPNFNKEIGPEEFGPVFPKGAVVTDYRSVRPIQFVAGSSRTRPKDEESPPSVQN